MRQQLFNSLVKQDEKSIEKLLNIMKPIQKLPNDGQNPLTGTARRLVNSPEPMLKMAASDDNVWNAFFERIKAYSIDQHEDLLFEEYVTDQLNTWTNSTNKSSPYFSCFTYLLAMCYIRRNRKGALPIYKLHKRVGLA